jgi:hypothetical protein
VPRTLPTPASLEQLKNQARDLLRAYRACDPGAVRRIQQQPIAPASPPTAPVKLASALHVLAREYGFESWPKLKQHVQSVIVTEQQNVPLEQQVERLGSRDWRVVLPADEALVRAGKAGLDAAVVGLGHASPRVRRGCAGFLDHQGTDECVDALRQAALLDPVPAVRRTAIHALGCQKCKPRPLTGDLVELLAQVALSDGNVKVRQEAVWVLGVQPRDSRAASTLKQILGADTDRALLKLAHHALKRQDPEYRRSVDDRARAQGMARGRIKPRTTASP